MFNTKMTNEEQQAEADRVQAEYMASPEHAEQRLERLQSMIDNELCAATNNPEWPGLEEMARHRKTLGLD